MDGILEPVSGRRIAIAVVSAAGAFCLLVLVVSALSMVPSDCDNVAGTCLRQRQELALGLLAGLYSAAAAACAWIASRAARGQALRTSHIVLLTASLVIAIGATLIDPAGQLDNRYHGWLT
jgi:drug/metabolite transporter (DMT)-like permease